MHSSLGNKSETLSHSVTQAGMLSWLTAASTSQAQVILPLQVHRCTPSCPVNFFVFFIEIGFHHVAQVGLKLLGSSDILTSASQNARIIGPCTWPMSAFYI